MTAGALRREWVCSLTNSALKGLGLALGVISKIQRFREDKIGSPAGIAEPISGTGGITPD